MLLRRNSLNVPVAISKSMWAVNKTLLQQNPPVLHPLVGGVAQWQNVGL